MDNKTLRINAIDLIANVDMHGASGRVGGSTAEAIVDALIAGGFILGDAMVAGQVRSAVRAADMSANRPAAI